MVFVFVLFFADRSNMLPAKGLESRLISLGLVSGEHYRLVGSLVIRVKHILFLFISG